MKSNALAKLKELEGQAREALEALLAEATTADLTLEQQAEFAADIEDLGRSFPRINERVLQASQRLGWISRCWGCAKIIEFHCNKRVGQWPHVWPVRTDPEETRSITKNCTGCGDCQKTYCSACANKTPECYND